MPRSNHVRFVGQFERHGEAAVGIISPGDVAVVSRDVPRMMLLNCPCGCGDTLVINLDRRAGPAWRVYSRGNKLTLFPSYWRESGCESHFVVWDDRIYWCDWDDESWWRAAPTQIEGKVRAALTDQFISYTQLADRLEEIPWDVLQACNLLVGKGLAEADVSRRKGEFRKRA